MTARRAATNNNIRDLLEDLRLEMKGDIKEVSNKLDALDRTVSDNALKQAVSSTKIGMLIAAITLLVSSVVTLVVNKIIGKM